MSIKNKFGCTATRKIEEAGVVATALTAAAARGTSMLIVVKIVKIMTVYTDVRLQIQRRCWWLKCLNTGSIKI